MILLGDLNTAIQRPYLDALSTFDSDVTAQIYALYDFQTLDVTDVILRQLIEILGAYPQDKVSLLLGEWITFMPKQGLVSAWRTRAESILEACDLPDLGHFEAGVLVVLSAQCSEPIQDQAIEAYISVCQDPLTHTVYRGQRAPVEHFDRLKPSLDMPTYLDLEQPGVLADFSEQMCLGLSEVEQVYLCEAFSKLQRPATATECMMFAQINSEHCRHKRFKAHWTMDGADQDGLFSMIQASTSHAPRGVLSAYRDNGAVIEGHAATVWVRDPISHRYAHQTRPSHWVIKAETHNHPTGLTPFEGAATGCGGEIRDEAATARGALPKAGWVGFVVSDLHLPEYPHVWEGAVNPAPHLASPLKIMQAAPVGAARFNNEFGRPSLAGFFRTFEQINPDQAGHRWGYHKPVMLAGGMGQLCTDVIDKAALPVGSPLVVLGGPALLVGLGGGAVSSQQTVSNATAHASVQRSNPEMQRRCQAVINACWMLDAHNPILSIHDVGAGGLANAIPELVHEAGRGCVVQLESIPVAQTGMSALEIWCNESQERYVLAVAVDQLAILMDCANAEQCPYAVVGTVTEASQVVLEGPTVDTFYVDLPMDVLFKDPPREVFERQPVQRTLQHWPEQSWDLETMAQQILQHPAVADKSFLITIADRSVGGCVVRDQMVGPWQVPVADHAIVASGFKGYEGAAMAIGERLPVAVDHPAAAARLAVAEAITNIAAVEIGPIDQIKCSANWLADGADADRLNDLYDAVSAIGSNYCVDLGVAIPVGKDSLSLSTHWKDAHDQTHCVTAPSAGVVSVYAPVPDVRRALTPQLSPDPTAPLVWVGFKEADQPLGGSILAACANMTGFETADAPSAEHLKSFYHLIQGIIREDLGLAYHDRSDGGLYVTVCEMAFAARIGVDVALDGVGASPVTALFYEGCGCVVQLKADALSTVQSRAEAADLVMLELGHVRTDHQVSFTWQGTPVLGALRYDWRRLWTMTSYRMRALRDHPETAKALFDSLWDADDRGLAAAKVTFDRTSVVPVSHSVSQARPHVAIFRAPGTQGHLEMAAAFDLAGFQAIDVHLTDLLEGRACLDQFVGLALCGGFSFGDVLGAGRGVAQILHHQTRLKEMLQGFFERSDTFTLGICNGCQMLSEMTDLIPNAPVWPRFIENACQQFESRLVMVEVMPSNSLFFKGMEGSILPIVVAHGQGRAVFDETEDVSKHLDSGRVTLRFVDSFHEPSEVYPTNPNGSVQGITGLTSDDGRVTLMMPHPERLLRSINYSWCPSEWAEHSPWMQMFLNARAWVGV